jgi:hypothetical protein
MTSILRKAASGSWMLMALAVIAAGLAVVGAVGVFADSRTLLDQPIWTKPLKFGISFSVYALTLAWLMSYLRRGKRAAKVTAGVVAVAGLVELAIITTQVVRGTTSHYNTSTPLNEALWSAMGMTIVVLWLGTLFVAIMISRDGLPEKSVTWAVRFGLVIMLLGLAEGFLMTQQGETGAHSVGVADGGAAIPLTGWSATGGDLRIGHFVGIHALQALLLFAMVLPRFVSDAQRRTRTVFIATASYTGLFVLVTWQALRGQPLLEPDGVTLAALGALVIGTGLALLKR